MLLDVQHTASGRCDDMVAIPELTGEIPVATLTGRSESAVGHRLSATGLITRKMHGTAMLFQQLQGGDPDLRIELVDVTGNEQTNARHGRKSAGRGSNRRVNQPAIHPTA